MIVAGAGSGKTRVLTYRTAHLLKLGVRPESVLALTFTNKAADEMKGTDRRPGRATQAARSGWGRSIRSSPASSGIEAEQLGYHRNFSIYDTDDSHSLISGIMADLGISAAAVHARRASAAASAMAKNGWSRLPISRAAAQDPLIAAHRARCTRSTNGGCSTSNAMDFDDLLLKPLELFRKHRDVLRNGISSGSSTSWWTNTRTPTVSSTFSCASCAERFKNICVVGDDAQSIYAFRGADIRNILDFEKDYPDCKVFRLEQNYRSTKTILGAPDSLIRHNLDQIPKNTLDGAMRMESRWLWMSAKTTGKKGGWIVRAYRRGIASRTSAT